MSLPRHVSRVGLSRGGLSGKLTPGTGDNPTRLMLDSPRAVARFLFATAMAGTTYDALQKTDIPNMGTALDGPWVLNSARAVGYLDAAGLTLRVDEAVVQKLELEAERARAHYSRWLPLPGEQWAYYEGTINPAFKERASETLRALGWQDMSLVYNAPILAKFQFDTACECATKRDSLITMNVGLGKTRTSLAVAEYHRTEENLGPTIIVALRRHLEAWKDEFGRDPKTGEWNLPNLVERYGPPEQSLSYWIEKEDRPDPARPFLLVSFERLTRLDEDELEWLKRLAMNSTVILDEAYLISNRNTLRATKLFQVAARHHLSLTGTPLRNFAGQALPILQWTFRSGSVAFPNYRADRQSSQKAFERKFITWATADDGSRKKTPILKNAAEFNRMLSPLMARRLRGEPEVAAVLGGGQVERQYVDVTLDDEHREFYEALLEQFSIWYQRILEAKGEKGVTANEILVKLGYLVRGLSQPWKMPEATEDDTFVPPVFEKRPTAFHLWAMEHAVAEVAEGRQLIIAGSHPSSIDLIAEGLRHAGTTVLHGGVPMDERPERVRAFRNGEAPILLGSYGVIAEALNFPEASSIVLLEPTWVAAVLEQTEGRIIRGIVRENPKSYALTSAGTIYEYMHATASQKAEAARAGLDQGAQTTRGKDILDLQAFAYSIMAKWNPKALKARKYRLDAA